MCIYIWTSGQLLCYCQTGEHTGTGVVSEEGPPEAHMVVWGTDVVVQDTKRKFRHFLENFVDDYPVPEPGSSDMPMDGVTPYYMARLEEVRGRDL